ncbi:DUF3272 family protein [Streptococcus cristatus]|uniref:DUF3272 family protein n=1 Tax=Streptococcus cristatus TaxID=45634 RepID=UPI000F68D82D|nr:DUF3272 family protein [Streptococcus cristatus]RSJ74682.1 hypothetical protein D8799_00780 [Streptococcus cristatus]
MNRRQFIVMAVFTALETYFFNEAIMSENYLMAIFWAILIGRNLQISYMMGRIMDEIDKHLRHK